MPSASTSSVHLSELTFSSAPVCGVMITYHPTAAMVEHLRGIMAQVQGLVVVDNGSNPSEVDSLRNASAELGFHLVCNEINLGIADALNQGVGCARNHGFAWVLLLDQDSKMSAGFVETMLQAWQRHPERQKIATIHPRYMHPELGFRKLAPRARDGSYLWCMTSGTLMPTWIFDKIGRFASDFFIDWVDIEYCFRIRSAGFLLAEASEAILLHDPGEPAPAYFLGRRFLPSHHSAARRYYMSRNRIVVFRRYFARLPLLTFKAMLAALRDTAKCFLGETNRRRKLRNFFLGTWDGLTGRMGQRFDL